MIVEVVNLSLLLFLTLEISLGLSTELGKVSRNCTEYGWSETFPHYIDACLYEEGNSNHSVSVSLSAAVPARLLKHFAVCSRVVVLVSPSQEMYYVSVKALYTVGYSTSLVSLTMAMVILCRFR